MIEIRCDCGRAAILVTGDVIYPHRPELFAKKFWACAPCGAYVGCHPGSERPLGTLAGPILRQWRMRAHAAIDPLWIRGRGTRRIVYSYLERVFGEPVHVGSSDEKRCQEIIAALKGKTLEDLK